MSVQIAVRVPDRDLDALDAAVRDGRFESRASAIREGLARVLADALEHKIADQYRRAYGRHPQDPELGEAAAELMAEALETEEKSSSGRRRSG